jgi:LuxR family maltose regulon positive regulatory protein
MPESVVAADAELAAILAGDRLRESRWTEANALLAAAERALPDVPPAGRRRADTALATVQLLRARRLGDMDATVARAACLLGGADDEHAEPADAEREALALLNLGIAETWTWRLGDAVEHLERGLLLGRRLRRPYLEIGCLATLGAIANMSQQLDRAEELLTEALTIADRVGWAAHPLAGVAAMTLGAIAVERGRNDEGETLLLQAAPLLNQGPEPAAAVAQRHSDAMLAYADGRYADAYDAWRDGERLADELRAPHFLAAAQRQWQLRSLLRLGDDGPARAALAEAEAAGDEGAHWRNLAAHLRLRDGDPEGAAEAVAPTVAGTAPAYHANLRIEGHLLHAVARLRAGDAEGARVGVEEALALAGPQGRVWIVLSVPGVEEVLRAHPAHATAHGAHLRLLLDHLAGDGPAKVVGLHVLPDLSDRELAVLRFLPTNLSATEIGSELYLSVHTVKTHMRKLYAKLDVHRRAEAVDAGRALGLLGPQRRAA